jgi:pilus assembly protein Flp/PilA
MSFSTMLLLTWSTNVNSFTTSIARFVSSEDGPTAVEYAVMLALIILVCIGAIGTLGQRSAANFNNIANLMPSGS